MHYITLFLYCKQLFGKVLKKLVKDEEILDQITNKLNKFELAIGNETDLLCKHYYKLGIVDSKKILMEIGE